MPAQFDSIPTETTSCRCSMPIKKHLVVYTTHTLRLSVSGFNGCTITAPFFLTKLSSTLQATPPQPNNADDNNNNKRNKTAKRLSVFKIHKRRKKDVVFQFLTLPCRPQQLTTSTQTDGLGKTTDCYCRTIKNDRYKLRCQQRHHDCHRR